MQVVPIVEALKQLPGSARAIVGEREIMSSMNWPTTLLATVNFLRPSSQRAVTSSHVRRVDALILFEDGSALMISERECEQIVRALRMAAVNRVNVLLVHLSCVKDVCFANRAVDKVSGDLGYLTIGNRNLLGDTFVGRRLQHAVVAAQLFNGQSEFGAASTSLMQQGTVDVLRQIVYGIGDRQCKSVLSGREGRDAAHQLIRMREQASCWPGSTLEEVCQKQMSAENVGASSKGLPVVWGWVSPASPFLKNDI